MYYFSIMYRLSEPMACLQLLAKPRLVNQDVNLENKVKKQIKHY